jgi:WD40-like Beta Propeller Repeat
MRQVLVCLALLLVGCAAEHDITLSTVPADANLIVDGENRGRGPVIEKFKFDSPDDVHSVTAQRLGFADQTVRVGVDYQQPDLAISLKPRTKQVTFFCDPLPAIISVDDKQLSSVPVKQISVNLDFTVDGHDQWITHRVSANLQGWTGAAQVIHWADSSPNYVLQLGAQHKDLHITTTPPGAQVYINDDLVGTSPVDAPGYAFPIDPTTNQPAPRKVKAVLPGYDPVEAPIGWDNGQSDYHVDLVPHAKTVRLVTSPPGGQIVLDGAPVPADATGVATVKLIFPPIDAKGNLKTFAGMATKQSTDTQQWFPQPVVIGWDEGKSDYTITLKEIMTRQAPMLRITTTRTDGGWTVGCEQIETLAMKDVAEPADGPQATRISDLPTGTMLGSLVVSPDGSQILFNTLTNGADGPRARLRMIKTDGAGGETQFGDDKSFDIMPAFTPDGSQIVFASNRGGKRMSIWEMSAAGDPGITQITSGEENDIWPVVDSDPKPRLFYQALVDTRSDPRLFSTVMGATSRTDLGAGEQPRISPTGDAILYVSRDEKTGKRQIFRMGDKGGLPVLLTGDMNHDEFDPVWNKDGRKIAFVSDRGSTPDAKNNCDIWVIDVAHPQQLTQVTRNGSWDDSPGWDPTGKSIYFRSNRGGQWGIWRIDVK